MAHTGFTGVGLPMGTRSGSLDLGMIIYHIDQRKLGTGAIERLHRGSELLGMSGVERDMRGPSIGPPGEASSALTRSERRRVPRGVRGGHVERSPRGTGTDRCWALWMLGALLATALVGSGALADDGRPDATVPSELVKQANAPVSSVLQVRLQDTYAPQFWDLHGQGNTFSLAITMPLPEYRLLPFPQLSLLTVPVAITVPGDVTGFGDLRFADIAVLDPGARVLLGLGATLVFPTASTPVTGQGKWQAGPAAAIAFAPENWLLGVLAQNPISFAGDRKRPDTNALFLQPFVIYQLGGGWFIRSQPQMSFNWMTGKQVLPVDLGVGRVFKIGRQNVNVFVEPFWNVSHDGPAPKVGITFGASLLYPDFWRQR